MAAKVDPQLGEGHADSEALIRIAASIHRGIPLFAIGYDDGPWQHSRPDHQAEIADDAVLYLATDLRDERHPRLEPDHKAHSKFLWICRMQDTWSLAQHREVWTWALEEWPTRGGKSPHRQALEFAVGHAVERLSEWRRQSAPLTCSLGDLYSGSAMDEARQDLEDFCGRLGNEMVKLAQKDIPGLTRGHADLSDLERLGILEGARLMLLAPRHHLREAGPLPRVVTSEEVVAPTLQQFATWASRSTAADASHEIVRAAVKVVNEMLAARGSASDAPLGAAAA